MRVFLVLLFSLAGTASPAWAAEPPVILVLGDSLSAGYGLAPGQGWVALLQQRLKREGYGHRVVNASVSGETTDGGVARLDRALATHKPDVVIIELGGNDGLRGLPASQMQANLTRIVESARRRGARVLLLGIRMPPNYGPQYVREFEAVFTEVARRHKVPFVPFLLQGVADRRDLMQPDNIHPTAAAQPVILETVWKGLRPLLRKSRNG